MHIMCLVCLLAVSHTELVVLLHCLNLPVVIDLMGGHIPHACRPMSSALVAMFIFDRRTPSGSNLPQFLFILFTSQNEPKMYFCCHDQFLLEVLATSGWTYHGDIQQIHMLVDHNGWVTARRRLKPFEVFHRRRSCAAPLDGASNPTISWLSCTTHGQLDPTYSFGVFLAFEFPHKHLPTAVEPYWTY